MHFNFAALYHSASCFPGSLLGKLSCRLHKSRVVKFEDSALAAVAARSQLFLHDRKKTDFTSYDGFCCYMYVGSDAATIATVV